MRFRALLLTITLVSVILVSIIAGIEWFNNEQRLPSFFVGVECAYGNESDIRDLVDKVRNYTNLFVIGLPDVTFNQTALNETCDYIYNAGLYFIILFTAPVKYVNYYPYVWIIQARQKYGVKFLGVYYFDEPGGNQLDDGKDRLAHEAENYTDAAKLFIKGLYDHAIYFLYTEVTVFTADYGLYWFDYKAGYDSVFAEFGWNHSRQLAVALCRGAARAQNKDWGVIVTWTFNGPPYLESANELYDDLVLAYHAGAKYSIVFNYPEITRYGLLTEEHFDSIKRFWNHMQSNPESHGDAQVETAYVLPEGYGFGFRNPHDTIWGLWSADEASGKIWNDLDSLFRRYPSNLDIVYDDPEFQNAIRSNYNRLIFWNETGD